ncbi:hypothetical protein [Bacillus sp. FJAT-52991]|uniref:Uncharacterized protein n=1 Tax=Bacillus kandeliae TaxID=3129297 RepID=A0ABZ2NA92_9BACI
MFFYKSPIGTFKIGIDKRVGKYALVINDVIYGHYPNTLSAADDVYMHVTGCYEWDSLDGTIEDVPTDIYEWEKV